MPKEKKVICPDSADPAAYKLLYDCELMMDYTMDTGEMIEGVDIVIVSECIVGLV